MFFNFGMQEMVIVGMVAVLLFGKKLPEVARSLGGSYREFRKGLAEMQAHMQIDDISPSVSSTSSQYANDDIDDYEQPTAPKFEPPTSEPTAEDDANPTSEPTEEGDANSTSEPTEEDDANSTSEPTAEGAANSTSDPTEEHESKPSSEPAREEV